ncbi:mitochondrial dynamin GTPase Msp1 [Apiospora marii]|uniref:mitochondrial dynamin GTPase Msp1 n=1 Tax=Apiospora marii TaxID=335849 RepID=UPI003132732D
MGDRRRGGSDYIWDVTLLLGLSTLADPEKEKHEQARIKAKANLQRLQKSREHDGTDGDESASSSRKGPHVEDLQLNEYENLVAMEVVAPEDISVGFDGRCTQAAVANTTLLT